MATASVSGRLSHKTSVSDRLSHASSDTAQQSRVRTEGLGDQVDEESPSCSPLHPLLPVRKSTLPLLHSTPESSMEACPWEQMDGYSASVTSLAIEGSATNSSAVPLWMSSQELSQSLGVPCVSTREILASSVLPGIIIDAPPPPPWWVAA